MKILSAIWGFLSAEKMPVWLTLILIVLGAIGTYILAPRINAQFENQKIRSAYIVNSLNTLNSATRELVKPISIVTNRLADGAKVDRDIVEKILSQISELQWRAIEFRVIFDGAGTNRIIDQYQKQLDDVRVAIDKRIDQLDHGEIVKETREFSEVTLRVLQMISEEANISIENPSR